MADAGSAGRVAKVDAGNSVAKKDVAGRVVEPLAPVSASSSGIAMLAQAKLSVGRVDDPAELEADQMAQKFSQWNGAGGSVEVSEGSSGGDAMRSADTGTLETGGFEVGADVQSEISSRSGRGVPLADDQRSKFEQFFGKDLSAVRVHADSDASQLSGSLGAEAFTVGNDVYFGSGRYQSGASDKLLAHELTHVVQQNSTINRWPKWMEAAGRGIQGLFGGKKTAPAPTAELDNDLGEDQALFEGGNEVGSNYDNFQNGNLAEGPTPESDLYDNFQNGELTEGPAADSPRRRPMRVEDWAPTGGSSSTDASTGFGKRTDQLTGKAPGGRLRAGGEKPPTIHTGATATGASPARATPANKRMRQDFNLNNPRQQQMFGVPNAEQRTKGANHAKLQNNQFQNQEHGESESESNVPTAQQRQLLMNKAIAEISPTEEDETFGFEEEPEYVNWPPRRGSR